MLTSKQRAELRAQANGLETILMVGKDGITDSVIDSANGALESRELIKGRVLETAGLTAREAADILCRRTGAEGVQCVGTRFVLYRHSKKLEAQRAAKNARERAAKKRNPVKAGAQARRRKAKADRERKDAFFREQRRKTYEDKP